MPMQMQAYNNMSEVQKPRPPKSDTEAISNLMGDLSLGLNDFSSVKAADGGFSFDLEGLDFGDMDVDKVDAAEDLEELKPAEEERKPLTID